MIQSKSLGCHHPDSPGIQLFLSVMVYVLRIHFFEGSR